MKHMAKYNTRFSLRNATMRLHHQRQAETKKRKHQIVDMRRGCFNNTQKPSCADLSCDLVRVRAKFIRDLILDKDLGSFMHTHTSVTLC